MKNPSTEILLPPENALLMFGNGYFAQTGSGGIVTEEGGVPIVIIPIKPHPALRKAYNIKDEELNQNGFMRFSMNRKDLYAINEFDNANRVWIYEKSFDHKPTPMSERSKELLFQLELSERTIWVLQGNIIFLSEQFELAKNNPAEYSAQVFEMADKISSKSMEIIGMKQPGTM